MASTPPPHTMDHYMTLSCGIKNSIWRCSLNSHRVGVILSLVIIPNNICTLPPQNSSQASMFRPVARLTERGVHVKIMQASGHAKYNLMRFKLSMLVFKI